MNSKWTIRLGIWVLVAMMYAAALWPFDFIPVCVNPKEIFLKDFTAVFSRKDMVINILGFIPLSILVALNFSRPRRPAWLKIYLVPVLIGFGVSFSFEFLQQFTYSRNPNLFDIFYNVGGATLGSIAVHVRERIEKR